MAIREAQKAKETGEETVILTALCGHGHFDLTAYDAYLSGAMEDEEVSRKSDSRRRSRPSRTWWASSEPPEGPMRICASGPRRPLDAIVTTAVRGK